MIAARFTRRFTVTALVALALLAAPPALAATTNRPNKLAVATFPTGMSDLFVSITGRGFGTTPPGASLAVTIMPITGSPEGPASSFFPVLRLSEWSVLLQRGDGNLGAIAVDESTSTVWYGEYCRKRLARHFPIK
jgi:hypothetical protein